MKDGPDISSIASLIADPARANMLSALMDGRAFAAGELAREAGVTPQTASGHLARLREAGFVVAEIQGRHRYFRLAGPEIAIALETLMGLAHRVGRMRTRPGPRDPALREARVCYDHLAGAKGVRLYDMLSRQQVIGLGESGDIEVTATGRQWLRARGVSPDRDGASRRPLCRICLDWSERRSHLAGALGARLLEHFLARGWCRRDKGSRAVTFTPMGLLAFERFVDGERVDRMGTA